MATLTWKESEWSFLDRLYPFLVGIVLGVGAGYLFPMIGLAAIAFIVMGLVILHALDWMLADMSEKLSEK